MSTKMILKNAICMSILSYKQIFIRYYSTTRNIDSSLWRNCCKKTQREIIFHITSFWLL